MELNVYLHVPFCLKKCGYCDFFSVATEKKSPVSYLKIFLKTLKKEIYFWDHQLKKPPIKTLYFGGGTPSILSPRKFKKIVSWLKENFTFSKKMEFSLEANPETITIEKISAWQKAGVNRLSLGIQTFSDKYLKILGRIHTTRKSIATIKLVKKYFKNFNIDLMFGLPESVGHNTSLPARRFALAGGEPLLPLRMTKNKMKKGRLSKSGQTVKEFEADLKKAVSLKPAHISVYQLTPEPKTPLWKLLKNKQLQLPEEETLFKMYHLAINFLKKSGYQHYEISNFARPGRECRHNLAIWHFEPYLGLGPAAHSFLFNRRFANPADIKEYSRRRRPLFPVEKLPPKKLMSEFVFLGLRCLSGINLSDFRKLFHTELPEIYRTQLEKLKKQKLLKISPKKIRLTTKGIFLGNEVFQEFI